VSQLIIIGVLNRGCRSFPIKIKFLDHDSIYLCTNSALINACSQVPLPCTPDYDTIPWATPDSASLDIQCSPIPAPPCHLTFSYTYRNVTVGGIPLWRDVQVLSTHSDSNCTCDSKQISQMLENIWSNQNVIRAFGLYNIPKQNWPFGTDSCFTNFRVITTDCWEVYLYMQNGQPVFSKKCNNDTCCYAVYSVCYHKSYDGLSIEYIDTSFKKQYYDYVPVFCTSPCVSLNCNPWQPIGLGTGGDNVSGKAVFEENVQNNNK